jgi:hypothetical protein
MQARKTDTLQPIIVDAGKQRGKRIKQLKRGEGKLAERVQTAAQQVALQHEDEGEEEEILPVVLIVRKASKSKS